MKKPDNPAIKFTVFVSYPYPFITTANKNITINSPKNIEIGMSTFFVHKNSLKKLVDS